MNRVETPAELIAAWQAAFRHANGKEPFAIRYDRGWYRFNGMSPMRAKDLRAATARLLARPATGHKEQAE